VTPYIDITPTPGGLLNVPRFNPDAVDITATAGVKVSLSTDEFPTIAEALAIIPDEVKQQKPRKKLRRRKAGELLAS
jgi:hypothetical protein